MFTIAFLIEHFVRALARVGVVLFWTVVGPCIAFVWIIKKITTRKAQP